MKALIILLVSFSYLSAQQSVFKSVVFDNDTKMPIAYANIVNKSTNKVTKSNELGYFSITVASIEDTILISYLGYEKLEFRCGSKKDLPEIFLKKKSNFIKQVEIKPKNSDYLYEMIEKCNNKIVDLSIQGKTYFELKSYHNDKQIELVECYSNAELFGYKVLKTNLKAGRLALQPDANSKRIFTTLASSLPIISFDFKSKDKKYPNNPIAFGIKKAKKKFYLEIENIFVNQDLDSIFELKFFPKDKEESNFSGTLWINKKRREFEKVNFVCEDCKNHPFSPIRESDSIKRVDMNMTFEFAQIGEEKVFRQVDYIYDIFYKNRRDTVDYKVSSKAIMYVYDFSNTFILPRYSFAETAPLSDYSKISAYPYNEFFWKFHDESRLESNRKLNDSFFEDIRSITNIDLFDPNRQSKMMHIFGRPYVHWSDQRINFTEDIPEKYVVLESFNGFKNLDDNDLMNNDEKFPQGKRLQGVFRIRKGNRRVFGKDFMGYEIKDAMYGQKEKPYLFDIKLFMDVNYYKDSLHFLTETIFDPFSSYYYFAIDNNTRAYMNMYYDICEIERRNLEEELRVTERDYNQIFAACDRYNSIKDAMCKDFDRDVFLGTREFAMKTWSKYIKTALGVDNLKEFRLYNQK